MGADLTETDLVVPDGITVKIRSEGGTLPRYQTPSSSGMDLHASQDLVIEPGKMARVPTGLFLEMPEGVEAQIRPRSGLAFKYGVTVLNAPGTIDADYRGEVQVLLINHGHLPFSIHSGDRIAQVVFASVLRVFLCPSDTLCETERGQGGFGSTGL